MAQKKKLSIVIAALFAIILIIFKLPNISAQDTVNIGSLKVNLKNVKEINLIFNL